MNVLKGFFIALFIIILIPSLLALSFAFILNTTLLDSDFMIAALSSIDISFILDDILKNEIKAEIPKEVRTMFSGQIKSLLENQLKSIVTPVYNYLLGESEILEAVVSLATVKKELKPVVLTYMLSSQPEKYHPIIKKEFDTYWKDFSSKIPDKIELHKLIEDKSVFERIEFIKKWLSIFQQVVSMLIVISIILILLIIIIQRNIAGLLRILGVIFLLLGIIFLPISFLIDFLSGSDFFIQEIPVFIYSAVLSLLTAIMNNIRLMGIAYIVGGSICVGGYFVFRRNPDRENLRGNETQNNVY